MVCVLDDSLRIAVGYIVKYEYRSDTFEVIKQVLTEDAHKIEKYAARKCNAFFRRPYHQYMLSSGFSYS